MRTQALYGIRGDFNKMKNLLSHQPSESGSEFGTAASLGGSGVVLGSVSADSFSGAWAAFAAAAGCASVQSGKHLVTKLGHPQQTFDPASGEFGEFSEAVGKVPSVTVGGARVRNGAHYRGAPLVQQYVIDPQTNPLKRHYPDHGQHPKGHHFTVQAQHELQGDRFFIDGRLGKRRFVPQSQFETSDDVFYPHKGANRGKDMAGMRHVETQKHREMHRYHF